MEGLSPPQDGGHVFWFSLSPVAKHVSPEKFLQTEGHRPRPRPSPPQAASALVAAGGHLSPALVQFASRRQGRGPRFAADALHPARKSAAVLQRPGFSLVGPQDVRGGRGGERRAVRPAGRLDSASRRGRSRAESIASATWLPSARNP